jgi:hypothetical protein
MKRRVKSPDPQEAQRQALAAAAAKLLSGEDEGALVVAWSTLLFAWEAAGALRAVAAEFFVDGAVVREFLASLRSLLRNGLPREVADSLGKAHED